jgi:lipoprotein-releasing system ATP-binding protein
MTSVLKAVDLCKTFKKGPVSVPVLSGVNIDILPASLTALMGRSGSGKTTLLQLLGGLDQPTSGQVFVDQQPISSLSERERSRLRNRALGFVYQFHHLLPEFTAFENVAMPLLIRGDSDVMIREKAEAMIERVGLADRRMHQVGELSGGECQRIAIARALVTNPACVLADEPTGNLDEKTADGILSLIFDLNKSLSMSFLVVTHNPSLATALGRVLHLKNGSIFQEKLNYDQ